MKNLSIDLETYSSADIRKTGVYKYAEAEDFEILLFGYSVDGGEVQVVDLTAGEKIPPAILAALDNDTVIKWAFNATFERVCLSRYVGHVLKPGSWHCSMVWAGTLGLPMTLAGVGAVLGLEKQKMTEGKALIQYFCKPCKATKSNGGRTRNLPADDPDKWAVFKAYNKRDVETELAIKEKLARFPVPGSEWENYRVDQIINDRGVAIDQVLAQQAIRCDEQGKEANLAEAKAITGLENPNSPLQILGWLKEHGLEADSLAKDKVAELLESTTGDVHRVLELRQLLSKSSVKKYTAMETCRCRDGRAHGLFQFYGATHTGRYAGRLIQVQNLRRNSLPDLAEARSLVREGQFEMVDCLYESTPDVLSQLIRTAFVPAAGYRFIVADYSAIEARVIAWLAGEQWRQKAFKEGADIYCASASQMFGVPVKKHGINGHLRQKGKIAELACIAEGQLVLTNKGLVPIQCVTRDMKVWDGEEWVSHDGVVCRGQKEVIHYGGLTATSDHLVYVQGESEPVQFGIAAASRAHLVEIGNGWRTVWMGKNYIAGEKVEQGMESLLCSNAMYAVRNSSMDRSRESSVRQVKGMPAMLTATENSKVARSPFDSGKAEMRKSERFSVWGIWRTGDSVLFLVCIGSRSLDSGKYSQRVSETGDRSNRYEWQLRAREYPICSSQAQSSQSSHQCAAVLPFRGMAILQEHSYEKIITGNDTCSNYRGSTRGCTDETEELASYRSTARVYDILNAGPRHRYTVSGKLVHNCGYGGGVGALKAMGALEMGLPEAELPGLIAQWRESNPHIVQLWWDVDKAVKQAVKDHLPHQTHGLVASWESGILFLRLPSGRRLAYVKPKIEENQFGGESVTYEGTGTARKWMRLESYGPKFCENITQAIARDLLAGAMKRLTDQGFRIVMHVHDEVIVEVLEGQSSVEEICDVMCEKPEWGSGLVLNADGYECNFYMKD